jgi:hypothetical protein
MLTLIPKSLNPNPFTGTLGGKLLAKRAKKAAAKAARLGRRKEECAR